MSGHSRMHPAASGLPAVGRGAAADRRSGEGGRSQCVMGQQINGHQCEYNVYIDVQAMFSSPGRTSCGEGNPFPD